MSASAGLPLKQGLPVDDEHANCLSGILVLQQRR